MNPIVSFFTSLLQPVSDAYKANQDRQAAKETAVIKLQSSQLEDKTKMELTDAEWEALAAAHADSSWKDEYVTLVITSPIVCMIVGGVWATVTGDHSVLDGINLAIVNLTQAGINMGNMMTAVVYAAIGLKIWRK